MWPVIQQAVLSTTETRHPVKLKSWGTNERPCRLKLPGVVAYLIDKRDDPDMLEGFTVIFYKGGKAVLSIMPEL